MAGSFAHGTVLTLTAPAAGALLNLTNISLGGWSADPIDVSDHNSADAYREFIQGMKDGGEISVEANYVLAEAIKVQAAFDAGTVMANCTMAFPGALGTLTIDLIATGIELPSPFDDKLTANYTFKVTGKPVLA